jgi:hypothetical protein
MFYKSLDQKLMCDLVSTPHSQCLRGVVTRRQARRARCVPQPHEYRPYPHSALPASPSFPADSGRSVGQGGVSAQSVPPKISKLKAITTHYKRRGTNSLQSDILCGILQGKVGSFMYLIY